MIAVALFLFPAVWLAYLVGTVLQKGVAAVLYVGLNSFTPFLIAHQDRLALVALALGALGNAVMLLRSPYFRWERALFAYPLVFGGGVMWMAACLVAPGWVWGPFNGLLVFIIMTMTVLAVTVAHFAMHEDEILEVLAWVAGALIVVGGLHMLLRWGGLV